VARIQFTLTVNAGKWLIARSVSERADVRHAFYHGRIILFGGTTVSAVSELLAGKPLRISGRITSRGTGTAWENTGDPHTLVMYKGKCYDYEDKESRDVLNDLGEDDIVVTGANIYDRQGNAAIMAGGYGFGGRRSILTVVHTEGAKVLVAVGVEKLIPGLTKDAIYNSGRKLPLWSMGASVGLVPIVGEIVNELEAVKSLTETNPIIIGRGGIDGGEGSATIIADGTKKQLEKLLELVKWASNKNVSGSPGSLKSCDRGSEGCAKHIECCYKSGKMFDML